jgi:hypothetical protein
MSKAALEEAARADAVAKRLWYLNQYFKLSTAFPGSAHFWFRFNF